MRMVFESAEKIIERRQYDEVWVLEFCLSCCGSSKGGDDHVVWRLNHR